MFSARAVGDDRDGSARDEQLAQCIAVIGPVSSEHGGGRSKADQFGRHRRVAALPRRDQEGHQPAQPVDQRVELGRGAASRAAYGVGERPPFPPVAERCALAQMLSSISSAGGPPAAASVSKARCHTPFLAHRTQRL